MDYQNRLAISYYQQVAFISEDHSVELVRHRTYGTFAVKKTLTTYNRSVFEELALHPVPGTPRILAFCEENETLIVIEEFVGGVTLSVKLSEAPLPFETVLGYANDLCDILIALHSFDPPIVHRDIKPSNIIITPYNRLVLLDFDAAKQYTDPKREDTVLLGTRGYAAPEQYGFGSSSPRSDIYAMGVLLKELCRKEDLSSLSPVLDRCTRMEPDERYASVEELKQALIEIQHPEERKRQANESMRRCLPPGFRTGTVWKMMVASIFYVVILFTCFTMEYKDLTGSGLWIARIIGFLFLLICIACWTDYCDIQDLFPICHNQNPALRILGIFLLNLTVVVIYALILFVGSSILFPS